VQFEKRAVEDRQASIAAGHYVAKDVDYVMVTPAGGNLVVEDIADNWLKKKRASNDPFADNYERAYAAWCSGQEIPVDGIPLKNCPMFSPADVANCLRVNVRTVEELATLPEQGLQNIGMGARALKQKAQAYLESAASVGKGAAELASLRALVEDQAGIIEGLQTKIAELEADRPKRGRRVEEAA
jgi:hypothetical protein